MLSPDNTTGVRLHTFFSALLLILLSLSLLSCTLKKSSYKPPLPFTPHTIENVPFFPQEIYECGPSSLATVLNFHGGNFTPEQIAQDIYRKDLRGTVTLDLILYARKKGYNAFWYTGNPDLLMTKIRENKPIILMIDQGIAMIQQNHFFVVLGVHSQGIIGNSGVNENIHIPWNTLLPQWQKAKFWTLEITPK